MNNIRVLFEKCTELLKAVYAHFSVWRSNDESFGVDQVIYRLPLSKELRHGNNCEHIFDFPVNISTKYLISLLRCPNRHRRFIYNNLMVQQSLRLYKLFVGLADTVYDREECSHVRLLAQLHGCVVFGNDRWSINTNEYDLRSFICIFKLMIFPLKS